MATLILDTHKAISRLKDAGFEETKAAAIVDSLKDLNLEHVATKEDLFKLEGRLYKWGFGALLAQGALVVALIQLLGS